MLRIVLISAVLILFVGTLRRWFFQRAWRFIVPTIVGFAIGAPVAQKLIAGSGASQEVAAVLYLFAGLIIAGVLRSILDDVLGPPKDRE
jgi:hypothetical protein